MLSLRKPLGHWSFQDQGANIAIAVLCLALVCIVWTLAIERAKFEFSETVNTTFAQNSNLAMAFEVDTARSLNKVDQALLLMKHEYAEAGRGLDIGRLINSGLIDASMFTLLGVLDERGNLVFANMKFKPVNLADREYFMVHQQRDTDEVFIGKPMLGRVTGKWAFHMSRRINKPDGSFGGVIYAAIDPAYFINFYGQANIGASGLMMLVGLDGISRARQTGQVGSFGQDIRETTLFAEMSKRKIGSFLSLGKLDGVQRYMSFRALTQYPLVVSVGTSKIEALAPAEKRAHNYYLTSGLATVFILIFASSIIVVLSRHRRAAFALTNRDRHFRALIENASDLVVVIDSRGVITYASPAVDRIAGYSTSEVLGKRYLEFVHPEDVRDSLADLSAIISNPANLLVSEKRFRNKSGHWMTLETISRNALDDPMIGGIIVNARDITLRNRMLHELEFNNTILSTQQQTSLDAILVVDENAKIISCNQQFVDLWGVPEELVHAGIDKPLLQSIQNQVENPQEFIAGIGYLYAHKEEKSRDEIRLKDGRTIDRYSSPVIGKNNRYYGRVWYFRDVTEQKTAEQRIRTLNVLYATLSGVDHTIVHSTSRHELCERVSHVATEAGMWVGAWVGFIDDATKCIVPEAWSDSMVSYIKHMVVSVNPALPEGQGPTGNSVRTGVPYFCNDIFADPATMPWRKFARDFNVNTVAAVPLRIGNAIVGVINLYSTEKGIYTPEVQELVVEMGEDISFAMEKIEGERLRETAERSLVENEAKYRGLVEQNISGIYIIQNEKFVYVNPYFGRVFGYEPQELIGMPYLQLVAEPNRALVHDNIQKRLNGLVQSMQYAFTGLRKDGTVIDIGVHGTRAVYEGKPAVIGILQNITERKNAEEQAKQHMMQLEKAMSATIDAVAAMVDLRDPYTAGHERRVGDLAAAIGAEMGLNEVDVKGLQVTGYLHDVGKIAVPAEILSKPGKLNNAEFELIKGHARQGYEILKSIEFPWPVAQAVLQHHERLDGTGYPQGLKGDAISLPARILAVADTVEAMATHRPYRPAMGLEAALKEINEQSGKRYDAQVVAACLRLFHEKDYQLPAE